MKSQTRRLQPITTATLTATKHGEREKWAEAAHVRILRKANQEPKAPCVLRVLRLLRLLRRAETLRLELYDHWKTDFDNWVGGRGEAPGLPMVSEAGFSDPTIQAMNVEFKQVMAETEHEMKRYRWRPTIRPYFEFHSLEEMYVWRKSTEAENWENWAVFWLMRHVKGSGRSPAPILRFRQCRQCSAWFYALTDHQVHCSTKCRQSFYADSPEFRKKRARYMREQFRPREKKADAQSRASARKELKRARKVDTANG